MGSIRGGSRFVPGQIFRAIVIRTIVEYEHRVVSSQCGAVAEFSDEWESGRAYLIMESE